MTRIDSNIKSSLLSLGIGSVISLLILLFMTDFSFNSIIAFFTGPFSSEFYLGSMLNTCSLLIFGALGAVFALNSGFFNLGGEGQIYLSGFLTAIILDKFYTNLSFFPMLLTFITVISATGILCLLSGLLKIKRGTNELLTTFFVSAAIIPLVDYAIANNFRDSQKNLLATPEIEPNFRFTQLMPPSSFNASFFIAIFFCLAAAYFLCRTRYGYRMRMCGTAPEFAKFSGINVEKYSLLGMFLSGAFHGMTGFFAITGTYFMCHNGFYAGLGWNALSVALIANKSPAFVFSSSLVLSYVFTASDKIVLENNFKFDVTTIIQAVMFLFISMKCFSLKIKSRHPKKQGEA